MMFQDKFASLALKWVSKTERITHTYLIGKCISIKLDVRWRSVVDILLENNSVILIHKHWNGNYLRYATLQSLNSAIFLTFCPITFFLESMLNNSILSRQLPKSKLRIRENSTKQITKLRDKTIIMKRKIKRKETRKKNK